MEEGSKIVTTESDQLAGVLDAIKELRKDMATSFKELGRAIDKRKDAQHELQLKCGQHRGGYDQKIGLLEKDRDDAEEEVARIQLELTKTTGQIKDLEDERAERDTLRKAHARWVKILVPLASAGGLGTGYQVLQALGWVP